MKRALIFLTLVISACSSPQEKLVPLEEPVIGAPAVIATCSGDAVVTDDGIGGTGCK